MLATTLMAMLPACEEDDSPTAPPATAPTLVLNPSAEDRASLDAAISVVDNAWNAMDPAAYAANFASDVRFTSPLGVPFVGRAAVQSGHQGLFGGPYRGSRRTSVVNDILWLAATRAVVERTNDLTGYAFLPPNVQATQPGILRTREVLVLERRSGAWTIVRSQLTFVPPA